MPEHEDCFRHLALGPVTFFVGDLRRKAAELVDGYGFGTGEGRALIADGGERSVVLRKSEIELHLVEAGERGAEAASTARTYVERHGDGVADIAVTTDDVVRTYREAVRRGAEPVVAPAVRDGRLTASVIGFGDVTHTFVQRSAGAQGPAPTTASACRNDVELGRIDHFAVCVEPGFLDATVDFYEHVLDFEMIFGEKIVVGGQAMNSKVVQSASGELTFTVIEPDGSRNPGQIDDFLDNHGGAGVQHIALTTPDIVEAVSALQRNGVGFLSAPDAYYRLLGEHIALRRHSVDQLRRVNVLADEDENGQLFQIFTRSVHPRNTYFFEVIERFGATTFGSGNIQALYEAVEAQRSS